MPKKVSRPPSIDVSCPFCRSQRCEMISMFGQNLLTAQYYCHACHSVFEAVKWADVPANQPSDETPR